MLRSENRSYQAQKAGGKNERKLHIDKTERLFDAHAYWTLYY